MTKLISAFPEWANYRVIAIAEDGTVYQIRLTEDGLAGNWTRIAEGIINDPAPSRLVPPYVIMNNEGLVTNLNRQ